LLSAGGGVVTAAENGPGQRAACEEWTRGEDAAVREIATTRWTASTARAFLHATGQLDEDRACSTTFERGFNARVRSLAGTGPDWLVLTASVDRLGTLRISLVNYCYPIGDLERWTRWSFSGHRATENAAFSWDRYDWTVCEFADDASRVACVGTRAEIEARAVAS